MKEVRKSPWYPEKDPHWAAVIGADFTGRTLEEFCRNARETLKDPRFTRHAYYQTCKRFVKILAEGRDSVRSLRLLECLHPEPFRKAKGSPKAIASLIKRAQARLEKRPSSFKDFCRGFASAKGAPTADTFQKPPRYNLPPKRLASSWGRFFHRRMVKRPKNHDPKADILEFPDPQLFPSRLFAPRTHPPKMLRAFYLLILGLSRECIGTKFRSFLGVTAQTITNHLQTFEEFYWVGTRADSGLIDFLCETFAPSRLKVRKDIQKFQTAYRNHQSPANISGVACPLKDADFMEAWAEMNRKYLLRDSHERDNLGKKIAKILEVPESRVVVGKKGRRLSIRVA